jgi:hypothetical protein
MWGWEDGLGSGSFGHICMIVVLVWILISLFITYLLYVNTVLGIDHGDYKRAKRWTLIGTVFSIFLVPFTVGIITLIIFLISYVSFDDALRPKMYYPHPYYPFPPQYPYGYSPVHSGPAAHIEIPKCRYCNRPMRYVAEHYRWYCDTCKKYL